MLRSIRPKRAALWPLGKLIRDHFRVSWDLRRPEWMGFPLRLDQTRPSSGARRNHGWKLARYITGPAANQTRWPGLGRLFEVEIHMEQLCRVAG
jgi:hypothetical protein